MKINQNLHRAIIIILGATIYAVGYYDRNCFGVLVKSMASSLHVSVAKCGILGSTYFWSYAIVQPFIGAIADFFDTSYIVSFSLFIASLGSLICGLSRNFYLSCFSRFLVGVGCGCIYVPICRSFAQWFSASAFPYAQSTIIAFGGLGGLLAQGPLKACIGENWPKAYYIASGLSIFLSLFALVFLQGTPEGRIKPKMTIKETFMRLFSNIRKAVTFKDFWMIACWKFLTPSQYSSVTSTWGATYLEQGLGYASQKAAKFVTMTSLGWTVGSPFMAVMSNWVHTRKWTMFFNTFVAAVSAFIFFSFTQAPSDSVVLAMLFLFALFCGSSLVISAIMFKEMYGKDLVGTMMGCGNFFMLIGTSISQNVTSAILATYTTTKEKNYPLIAFRYGLWLLAAVCITVSLGFVLGAKDTYKKAIDDEINAKASPEPLLSQTTDSERSKI